MAVIPELVVIDPTDQAAGRCVVCGNEVGAGAGVAARFGDRTLRFKCPGCLSRFTAAPEMFLAGHPDAACGGGCQHHSPASEWACD